jgi:hypothetical protein
VTPSADGVTVVAPRAEPARRTARRNTGVRGPSLATALGAGLVVWGLHIGLARFADNSFFTHLATGRLMLESGSIPRADPYTFTAAGEPWVVQSWLASLTYAGVERVAGLGGLRLLIAVTTALLVALIWMLTRRLEGVVARFAVAGSVVAVGAAVWAPRPLMVGLVCLGLTLLVIERRWPPFLLLPIMWVWVNTHGSFPLGLVAIAALAIGHRLDGERPTVELRALGWSAAGVVVGVANPLGLSLLTFPLTALRDQETFRYVIEWQSPDFGGSLGRVFLVQLALVGWALMRAPRWRSAIPLLVFGALALISARNIAVASIVLVPGMVTGFMGLGSLRNVRNRATAVVFAAVCALGALIVVTALERPAFELDRYPVDAVAWATESGLLREDARVVLPDFAGNYLELVKGPEANVFDDDRVDMLPVGVVEDAVALLRGQRDSTAILERWEADVVIWETGSPLSAGLSDREEWVLVYQDGTWSVFIPR